MKKIFMAAALSAALIMTGCGGTSQESSSVISEGSLTSKPEPIKLKGEVFLKEGIWEVTEEGEPVGYYVVAANGEGGETLTYKTGFGEPFTYAIHEDNTAEFHFGDDIIARKFTVNTISENELKITDNHDNIIHMTYYSEGGKDDIHFRSNEAVATLAANYYKKVCGSYLEWSTITNEDGTVTVRLHAPAESGNGLVVYKKYTVDRETCKGTDDMGGGEVDLMSDPPVMAEIAEE